MIISEIQTSSVQSAYGGVDPPNAYRTPAVAGTSKVGQPISQAGGSLNTSDPMPVNSNAFIEKIDSKPLWMYYLSFITNRNKFNDIKICILFYYLQSTSVPSTSSQQGKIGRFRSGFNPEGVPLSGVRSLSANLKYPYKRTISAPAGMGLSQKSVLSNHSRGTLEKEMSTSSGPMGASGGTGTGGQNTPSTCHRQQSAPILKGKMSKESSHVLSKQGNISYRGYLK